MVEHVLQSHRFRSGEDLEQTILRYVRLYNDQPAQSVLKGRAPINALKHWHRQKPAPFKKPHAITRDVTVEVSHPGQHGNNQDVSRLR